MVTGEKIRSVNSHLKTRDQAKLRKSPRTVAFFLSLLFRPFLSLSLSLFLSHSPFYCDRFSSGQVSVLASCNCHEFHYADLFRMPHPASLITPWTDRSSERSPNVPVLFQFDHTLNRLSCPQRTLEWPEERRRKGEKERKRKRGQLVLRRNIW